MAKNRDITQALANLTQAAGYAPDERGWRLMALDEAARAVTRAIAVEALGMREQGDSWARIGACLGTTRQAAQQRFGLISPER